jgi:hypothetical protein
MAIYYLNTAAGNKGTPYGTSDTGASTIWEIRQYAAAQLDAQPDIIVIANGNNDVIYDDSAIPIGVAGPINETHITAYTVRGHDDNEFLPIFDGENTASGEMGFQINTSLTELTINAIGFINTQFITFIASPVDKVTLTNNRIHSSSGQVISIISDCPDVTIEHNLIVTDYIGVGEVLNLNIGGGASTDITSIKNNTIITGTDKTVFTLPNADPNIYQGLTITNNIIIRDDTYGSGAKGVFETGGDFEGTFDYNDYYSPDGAVLLDPNFTVTLGSNDLVDTDPLMLDYVNGDYRLLQDSPVIGKSSDGGNIGSEAVRYAIDY